MQIWLTGFVWMLSVILAVVAGVLGGKKILNEYLLVIKNDEQVGAPLIKLAELPIGNMIVGGAGVSMAAQLIFEFISEILAKFLIPVFANISLAQWAILLVQSILIGGVLGPAGMKK